MTHHDFATRIKGKTYRFISDGVSAALFDKTGLAIRLTVLEDGPRSPKVADSEGNPVTLSRVSKPCSCVGAPWKARANELVAQL